MKKNILIIISVILISLIFNIPKYRELNNIHIIEGIGINCINDKQIVYLKEIIPEKDDSGIEYKYRYYTYHNKINNNKIYLKGTKYIITNCINTNEVINTYNLNPKYIYHTNKDIKKELSKNAEVVNKK